VHADIDPPKDGSAWDVESGLKALLDSPIPPSIIVNSGNGLQALWRLEGSQNAQDVEAVNLSIIQAFDGDRGTQNVDRLLRVPGTVNWPNKRKREQGRVAVLAKVIQHDNGTRYSVTTLTQTFPAQAQAAAKSGETSCGPHPQQKGGCLRCSPSGGEKAASDKRRLTFRKVCLNTSIWKSIMSGTKCCGPFWKRETPRG